MPLTDEQIEKLQKKVQAILNEASARPLTGRNQPGLGSIPEDAGVAGIIDHTLLKPDATARQIEKLCFEAKEYGFASVCVNSVYVPLAVSMLAETEIPVCTVVGFPLGATLPSVKVHEARAALEHGAREIDMVLHVGSVKNRHLLELHDDITGVAAVCHEQDALCKVILETALLDEEEIVIACQVAKLAGADFVKTSTGFSSGGATAEAVSLMRRTVGDGMGVKASGGIRSLEDAQAMIEAGANRLGASAGVAIAQAEQGAAPAASD